jgi:hypothetical protein
MLKLVSATFTVAVAFVVAMVALSTAVVDASDTIENIILKEKRFVLFNSRRLTGECLPICVDDIPTESPVPRPTDKPDRPTDMPFEQAQTAPPVRTDAPIDPTSAPVDPTSAPVDPTSAPVDPTSAPVAPTDAPVVPEPDEPFNPDTFCRQPDGGHHVGPRQWQIVSEDGKKGSCGVGVPWGYYPDLTRCDAYCYCTGDASPSRYEIIDSNLEWDTHQQGSNIYYLEGVYGKNGAWGTNGGAQGWPWQMSKKGRDRPPNCGGPTCPNKKTQPWNMCKEYYTCNNQLAGPIYACAPGLLFDYKNQRCDWPASVNCEQHELED